MADSAVKSLMVLEDGAERFGLAELNPDSRVD